MEMLSVSSFGGARVGISFGMSDSPGWEVEARRACTSMAVIVIVGMAEAIYQPTGSKA